MDKFEMVLRQLVYFVFVLCVSLSSQNAFSQESLWTRQIGNDWPQFLGPDGDGKSDETGIIKDWSAGNLKLLWKTSTGEGYGMGSVSNGRFFHFGRMDGKANLICLNAETGEPIWNFSYPSNYRDMYGYDSGPRASPIIDQNRVYIYGVEGMLHCLNVTDGKLIWKLDVNKKFGVIQNFFGVASSPVIFEDKIIVMAGGSPADSNQIPAGRLDLVKPNGTGIIALDKLTGQLLYQTVDDLASYCSLKATRFDQSPVILAWMRGSLFGLNPQNGKPIFDFYWRARKLESVNASMPVVLPEDQIFISECYERGSVLLKRTDSGVTPIWTDQGRRDKALEAHWNTPVVDGDYLYGCSGRHSGPAELRCIHWKTGEVQWKQRGLARSSITWIDGHLVVIGELGDLVLVKANPDRYEEVTRYEPGQGENQIEFRQPCWAAPVISHGLLYVRGKSQMACFELIPNSSD
ncbi:MAG: PQQ-binding-like beta-propeller repeat protein [Planctomycetota bacterium]